MMHFFRSKAWGLEDILNQWMNSVRDIFPVYKEDDMTVLVGDGVNQSKEARKMPGVKRLHQESENSSKAEYIFGHLFGGIMKQEKSFVLKVINMTQKFFWIF